MRIFKDIIGITLGILLLSYFIPWAAGAGVRPRKVADTAAERRKLKEMGIYPYPSREELKDCKYKKEWLKVKPVSPDKINADFSNLEDFAWLEPIAKEKRVFFLGESHYFQTIAYLQQKTIFALNTFDYYPYVLWEHEYSYSPFLDHYAGLADDKEAEEFYHNVIYEMLTCRERYERLENIRRWNKLHPEKRIHLLNYDIEWDYPVVLRKILIPYFQKLDPAFDIDLNRYTHLTEIEPILKELEKRMGDVKEKRPTGDYPFITPEYIACVVENLRSAHEARKYEMSPSRQPALIRNLTDPRYHGKLLRGEKVVIGAGSTHVATHRPRPEGENFWWEGTYLTSEFEPTKGKTYSLYLHGGALKIGGLVGMDFSSCLHQGTGFRDYLEKFKQFYDKKMVSPDEYYLFSLEAYPDLSDFKKLFFLCAYENNHQPLLIKKIDWAQFGASEELKRSRDDYNMYDAHIYVPRSNIIQPVKKQE